ncbi:hypothetical protein Pelo_12697 [Pelomyxa schiedti]|nr:hypothetical protein Pelo_12697 [Pelomyxa schiedti]
MQSGTSTSLLAAVGLLSVVLLARNCGCVGIPDSDGFPSYDERVQLQLANRARCDPQVEMEQCGSSCADAACYTPIFPLKYSHSLGHGARFHAAHMETNNYFSHPSACTLEPDLPDIYPGSCTDAAASCSCVGGTLACNPTCTDTWGRIAMFTPSGGSGEIIVSIAGQYGFYLWLYEPTGDSTCQFTMQNGHRWLLLKSGDGVGFGVFGNAVGDFGASDESELSWIPSGTHWPNEDNSSNIELWANWYDAGGSEPTFSQVNVDGICYDMELQRGVRSNGAYMAIVPLGGDDDCHRYFFLFSDGTNLTSPYVAHPTEGSLTFGNCGDDYESSRPDFGENCMAEPNGGGGGVNVAAAVAVPIVLLVVIPAAVAGGWVGFRKLVVKKPIIPDEISVSSFKEGSKEAATVVKEKLPF